MATFTATRAAANFPVTRPASGSLAVAWGTIEVSANPVASDVYQMCRIPKGAVVVGGYIYSDDLDTNATETLDLDVGWAANGTEAADPDGFGNLGVFTTDTVAGIKVEAGYQFPFGGKLITDGPQSFSAETIITVNCVATAATFAAGTLSVVVHYYVP
jgi:hypothetical protein